MRTAKPAAVALAACLLLGPLPASAQDAAKPPSEAAEPARGLGPLEKSLILPGWGQITERRWLEGILFLGGEAFCLWQALRQNKLGNDASALYKTASTLDDVVRLRAETESRDARRNQYLLAGAAVWALNLLDIYLIVKGRSESGKSLTVRIGHDATHALVVVAGYRF